MSQSELDEKFERAQQALSEADFPAAVELLEEVVVADAERAAACYRRALEIDPQHAKAEEFLIKAESLQESREHYRRGRRQPAPPPCPTPS